MFTTPPPAMAPRPSNKPNKPARPVSAEPAPSQERGTSQALDDDARYDAVRRRDRSADGQFWYSVLTTGVYCRPSCAARLARRENVGFHASPEAAERAGYRACKRCRPRDESADAPALAVVEDARRALESADEAPRLGELAARAGLSPFYFHRLFRKHVGMTPRQYAAASKLDRASARLREGASVTTALHDAGYGSSGRFYEEGAAALGMKPSDVRRGGVGIVIRATVTRCSLGRLLVAATERGVCAVLFGDGDGALRSELAARFPSAAVEDGDADLAHLAARIANLVDDPTRPRDIPLDLVGTAFQLEVWRALREIPIGETATYAEIARRIGAPRAVRAVGAACGKNPVAVVVPCHRVLRGDGALGGYRWGVDRKRDLLAREAAARNERGDHASPGRSSTIPKR